MKARHACLPRKYRTKPIDSAKNPRNPHSRVASTVAGAAPSAGALLSPAVAAAALLKAARRIQKNTAVQFGPQEDEKRNARPLSLLLAAT